ncbi:MAG TPA: class I SAM-dependent methyltransferase [Blastocatellia bacterium]|nr:class I SAM-dependent methyltransferase [Blastocatellia bacterium]
MTKILACPLDHSDLLQINGRFDCAQGHSFEIEQGIPVLARTPRREPKPRNMRPCIPEPASPVDPFVNDWIVNTNGNLYWRVRGRLPGYPIPRWPFETGKGRLMVDLGCGWGRWCMSASHAGYVPIGVDIHLDAVQAARRVSLNNGSQGTFLCSEIDALPFHDATVDLVFSYSVLQHVERDKVRRVLTESWRILKPGGAIMIQLPNTYGPFNVVQQMRRGFREARADSFEMRYWSPRQIHELLRDSHFGEVKLRADGFFSQNPQISDLHLLSILSRLVVLTSYAMSKVANAVSPLRLTADSLWVISHKNA